VSQINVTIDRIVLSGVDAGNRDAVVAGLRAGLTRALMDHSFLNARSRRAPFVRIGGLTLEPGRMGARRLGSNIGQAIGKAAR
jgi:hypothetical protein